MQPSAEHARAELEGREREAKRHAVADVFRAYSKKFAFLAQAAGFVAVMEGCAHTGPRDFLEPNQRDIIMPTERPKETSFGEDLQEAARTVDSIRQGMRKLGEAIEVPSKKTKKEGKEE